MNLFKDDISLIFIKSKSQFDTMTTDDFVSFDVVYCEKSPYGTTYSLEVESNSFNWKKSESFSVIKENSKLYDLLVEVNYVPKSFGQIPTTVIREIMTIKIMTYDFLENKVEKELVEFGYSEKRVRVTEHLTVFPKRVVEKETPNGKYNLGLIIKEFLRDGKLDDLGI